MDDKSSLLNQLRIDRAAPPQRSGRGWLWGLVGIAVLLVAGGGAWIVLAGASGVPVHAVVARAAAGSGGTAANGGSLLDASGYVVALRQATVSGKAVYKVSEVLIEAGQHVEKDQIIARLDDTNSRAALDQAQAQVDQAEANLAQAKLAWADSEPIYLRNKKLVAAGWISSTAYDNSKAAYDAAQTGLAVAQRQVRVARAGLEVAQRYMDDTIIRAPFTGVVTAKSAQPGEIVSPQFLGGGGVAKIVDMDSLEVQVDVSENFINRVHAGQPATITLNAYPDWAIPAEVIAIIPTADQTKATVKVRVAFKQKDDRVLPEMGARVSFFDDAKPVAGAAAAGVIVPADAVQGSGATGIVYIIHDDVVERRAVRLGARGADGQTVLSGLQPGASLAVADFSTLSDGAKIRIEQ
jgi:RND family efflux transporter MFP subunit